MLGSLAMLVITSEYATRTVVVSLARTPSRVRLVVAKAVLTFAVVFLAGVVLGALGTAVSVPLLGASADLSPGPVAVRLLAVGITLASTALLALGLVSSSAARPAP